MFAGGVEECSDQARHSRLPYVTVVTPECHSFSVQWELQWRFNRYQPTIFYAWFRKERGQKKKRDCVGKNPKGGGGV